MNELRKYRIGWAVYIAICALGLILAALWH